MQWDIPVGGWGMKGIIGKPPKAAAPKGYRQIGEEDCRGLTRMVADQRNGKVGKTLLLMNADESDRKARVGGRHKMALASFGFLLQAVSQALQSSHNHSGEPS